MVDIIVSPEHAVGMSIEAASNILDGKAAEEIIHAWSQLVEETLQV